MDIEKIQYDRRVVEEKMNKLLSEFEEKIGMEVSEITIKRTTSYGRFKSVQKPVVSLEIKI